MKKYLSALVCGFGAGVLQVVPIAKSFSCCLIIPAAVVVALILDRKASNQPLNLIIPIKKALLIGVFTGLYAALFGSVFDLLITFITKNNDLIAALPQIQKMIGDLPFDQVLRKELSDLFNLIAGEIKSSGFSVIYAISIIFNNLIMNTIFGLIGGLIGVQFINSKISNAEK